MALDPLPVHALAAPADSKNVEYRRLRDLISTKFHSSVAETHWPTHFKSLSLNRRAKSPQITEIKIEHGLNESTARTSKQKLRQVGGRSRASRSAQQTSLKSLDFQARSRSFFLRAQLKAGFANRF
jgi:hypothetical protein